MNESCPAVAKALFEDVRRQTRKEAPTCSKSAKNTLDALLFSAVLFIYDSFSDVGEIRVYWRADFQSGSRVLKKVF